MEMAQKFILPGILFLLTLVFGFWLSHTDKPLNPVLFNIHKLIALAMVVLTVIQFSKLLKGMNAQALIIVLLVTTALCVIALFATGALMSVGKLDYEMLHLVHKIAPVVLAVGLAAALFLLESSIRSL